MALHRRLRVLVFLVSLCAAAWAPQADGYELLAVDFDSGDMYGVSIGDASLTPLGSTGLTGFGSLELSPDGTLYGFTTGLGSDPNPPTLYDIDLGTFVPTTIGPLNQGSIFDGSLVFASTGTVYATNGGYVLAPTLLTIDMLTGEATVVGTISVNGDKRHDVNAMAWRSDGMLVGLDRVTNSLLAINPNDATATVIAPLAFPNGVVGGVGGMVIIDGIGYFSTSGPNDFIPGTNSLYRFDPFSGSTTLVGSFDGTITGSGIGGLALVPEPATLALLAVGGLALVRRKRRA